MLAGRAPCAFVRGRGTLRAVDVVIVGGHGKIARRLARLLVARGDRVRGVIRSEEQADDLRADGAEPIVCDLETASVDEVVEAVAGAEVVVFAAGAGPGSGAERKLTVDRDAAVKLRDAAQAAGAERYVIVSSIGAEAPPEGDEVFAVYLRAKAQADEALMQSDLGWTVVRPGSLTDDAGIGRVRLEREPFHGKVSRDDVAAVLAAVVHEPHAARLLVYVNGGDVPIDDAVSSALSG